MTVGDIDALGKADELRPAGTPRGNEFAAEEARLLDELLASADLGSPDAPEVRPVHQLTDGEALDGQWQATLRSSPEQSLDETTTTAPPVTYGAPSPDPGLAETAMGAANIEGDHLASLQQNEVGRVSEHPPEFDSEMVAADAPELAVEEAIQPDVPSIAVDLGWLDRLEGKSSHLRASATTLIDLEQTTPEADPEPHSADALQRPRDEIAELSPHLYSEMAETATDFESTDMTDWDDYVEARDFDAPPEEGIAEPTELAAEEAAELVADAPVELAAEDAAGPAEEAAAASAEPAESVEESAEPVELGAEDAAGPVEEAAAEEAAELVADAPVELAAEDAAEPVELAAEDAEPIELAAEEAAAPVEEVAAEEAVESAEEAAELVADAPVELAAEEAAEPVEELAAEEAAEPVEDAAELTADAPVELAAEETAQPAAEQPAELPTREISMRTTEPVEETTSTDPALPATEAPTANLAARLGSVETVRDAEQATVAAAPEQSAERAAVRLVTTAASRQAALASDPAFRNTPSYIETGKLRRRPRVSRAFLTAAAAVFFIATLGAGFLAMKQTQSTNQWRQRDQQELALSLSLSTHGGVLSKNLVAAQAAIASLDARASGLNQQVRSLQSQLAAAKQVKAKPLSGGLVAKLTKEAGSLSNGMAMCVNDMNSLRNEINHDVANSRYPDPHLQPNTQNTDGWCATARQESQLLQSTLSKAG